MMPTLLNLLSLHLDKSVEETLECVEILGVLFDCMHLEFEVNLFFVLNYSVSLFTLLNRRLTEPCVCGSWCHCCPSS